MKMTDRWEHCLKQRMRNLIEHDSGFLLWLLLFHSSVLVYNYRIASIDATVRDAFWHRLMPAILWWFQGFAEVFLVALLLTFLSGRIRTFLKGVVLAVTGLCFLADLMVWGLYHDVVDEAKVEVVLGTNPRTVLEFVQAYLLQPSLFLGIALLAILAVVGYRWMLPRLQQFFFHLSSAFVALFLISLMSVVMSSFFHWVDGGLDLPKLAYCSGSVNRMAMDVAAAYHAIGDLSAAEQEMERAREPIVKNDSDIPYVVFVVGEAADRNKMGVYGYRLDTTPRLSSRMQDDHLFVFDDTIAGAAYTTVALRQMFTFAEKGEEGDWYTYANLLDIVRDAGYHTAWISNQSPVNAFGNMDNIFSKRTDRAAFTAISGGSFGTVTRHLDEELLPLLDEELAAAQERNFFVLHLYGSHAAYYQRCPDDFHPFLAADETGDDDRQRTVKADYDNTIAYTDQVLDAILRRFEDRDAVVVYLSDHGEEVYDGRDFAGHSEEHIGNRHMIEIPMVIWVSPAFAKKRPETTAAIAAARHRPYRTDDIIHTFLDLMKIEVPSYRPEKSVISPTFEPPVRLWNGRPYVRGQSNP